MRDDVDDSSLEATGTLDRAPLRGSARTHGGGAGAELVRADHLEFIACRNATADVVDGLADVRGFHVIRDPRDLVVSAYYSHRNSHRVGPEWPELAAHRERLTRLGQADGLLAELDFSAPVLRDLASWPYGIDGICEVRMEDLFRSPEAELLRIAGHLGIVSDAQGRFVDRLAEPFARLRHSGLPIPGPRRIGAESVLAIAADLDFRKLTGRRPGEADPAAHIRSGRAGEWQTHFDDRLRSEFGRRWGDLVRRLGYEDDDSWF